MALHKYTLAHALQHSYHHENTALAIHDLGPSLHLEHQDNHAQTFNLTYRALPAHKFALFDPLSLAPLQLYLSLHTEDRRCSHNLTYIS